MAGLGIILFVGKLFANSKLYICKMCDTLSTEIRNMYAQPCPHLVRPSLTNTGEQRGRGGLTKITISSQVACDHCKVFRAELVSTPPDGLDTLTRSSKVRKR